MLQELQDHALTKLDRIQLFMVREGHSDDHFYGQDLPSIDELVGDIKEKIDASWYSANLDVEQMRIHLRFKLQAYLRIFDLPNLPKIYSEIPRK